MNEPKELEILEPKKFLDTAYHTALDIRTSIFSRMEPLQ